MKNATILWICAVVLSAAAGFFASSAIFGHGNRPSPELDAPQFERSADFRLEKKPHPAKFKEKMDSALGLSKEQIAKLDSNGKARDSLRREMRKKIRIAEKRLHDLLDSTPFNDADIQSVRAELLLLNEKRLDQRIADIKFFKSVLTKEQSQKLKTLSPKKFPEKPRPDAPNAPKEGSFSNRDANHTMNPAHQK